MVSTLAIKTTYLSIEQQKKNVKNDINHIQKNEIKGKYPTQSLRECQDCYTLTKFDFPSLLH
jgi:hypothetical protein